MLELEKQLVQAKLCLSKAEENIVTAQRIKELETTVIQARLQARHACAEAEKPTRALQGQLEQVEAKMESMAHAVAVQAKQDHFQ